MSQSRKGFPELPGPPKNKHVAQLASGFFSLFKPGPSPAVAAFYKANKSLLKQKAGPFSSWSMGMHESRYVQQHGDPSHPADQFAMKASPYVRAAAASFTGTVLTTTHRALLEAHPDKDPTSFGGSS